MQAVGFRRVLEVSKEGKSFLKGYDDRIFFGEFCFEGLDVGLSLEAFGCLYFWGSVAFQSRTIHHGAS